MKKWAVIDQREHDEFTVVCESKEAAVEIAKNQWDKLIPTERKNRRIIAGLINVDENGECVEYVDENGRYQVDADIYDIAIELC